MDMFSLRITSTDALIGINTIPANISISQPKADFEIHQKHAKVDVRTEPIEIRIDQRQCFNEAGLKDNTAFMEDNVQEAKQNLLQWIGRVSSEGNMMAAIENNMDAIAEIALDNSIQVYDFNVDFLPKSRPKIDFIGGKVDIQVDEGYVELKTKPNKPVIDVKVGGVQIYLRQNPELKIEYIGNNMDETI